MNFLSELSNYLPVIPALQAAVDDVFWVPDRGEVGQAVHAVTLGVAGPGHQQEPRLPAHAALPLPLPTPGPGGVGTLRTGWLRALLWYDGVTVCHLSVNSRTHWDNLTLGQHTGEVSLLSHESTNEEASQEAEDCAEEYE